MRNPTDEALAEWRRFRSDRDRELGQEHGWLTLTSLHWLTADPAPVEHVPGLWSGSEAKAVLSASVEDGLTLAAAGTPVDGTVTATLADEESLLWVRFGGSDGGQVVVELARRGGRYAIRTRDAASPVFTGFRGVPTFEFRPDLVVDARFDAYPRPVDVPIRTASPAVDGVHRTVGELALRLPGAEKEYRLQLSADGPDRLELTFHDPTNNQSTAGWRKVAFAAPQPGTSAVTVDFNRAVNYPSAFTPYGTCPMPVGSNIIGVPVEAGEKLPEAPPAGR
ncbi:DUF1684 domain-containing protein [Arthrobacter sp. zg-Y820]|uniref:DUF1684 domain-containing protein n=1 Tax=unclassified Arthrobacter TaxID=235627 RepID=UPI001E3E5F39|nr:MULTISPECIES: DUF1684 domain-containing protein [unclassified Arthrobacter]MCC9198570.1 DUF1684 domain-containing protein [Arthrobacter sp. zg-Y820]MDK1281440.1 DUF1684 domain-containing protein [Arthrobacter sp. zg.Y820]WIB09882.1 DUF1684 domain-containing protein [Arthrobacter sp. zg-Y820]